MTAPEGREPTWQQTYAAAVATPAKAIARIGPGQRVFIGTGCAQPQALVAALAADAGRLPDTEVVHLLTLGEAPYATDRLRGQFRVNSFFVAENVRATIQEGLGDYTPIFLSDIPNLFASGQMPLDAALIQVAPPDALGRCSLGISVDIVKSAAQNAALVVAQVNPRMPRTHGDGWLHVHDIDLLVPVDEPLLELAPPTVDATAEEIARHVATLIEDGATVELGIGRIPHAVAACLEGKRDIGIHTEMLTDAVIDLVERGVVTGARKSIDRGKVVASFCLGTRRLYDYVDDNPLFSFQPTEYVNDPALIARHHRMVAINTALQIDLTGQVCADSLGTRFFSGLGGHLDFNRGAARSRGGKAVIALPSTARSGEVSRIVTRLTPGSGVVTTRGDVHWVVTEYGVAYLHGKSVQERALSLIGIAHPDWRERLFAEAVEARYLRPELASVEGKVHVGPSDLETSLRLDDGTRVDFRPVRLTDLAPLRAMFYDLSERSVYLRFFSRLKRLGQTMLQQFVFLDHRTEVTVVGTVTEASGEEIVAVGHYFLDPRTNRAECAFLVGDRWQGRGLGRFLFRWLQAIARRNGIAGFTAEVLSQNRAMRHVFESSGLQVHRRCSSGVYHYDLDFG